MVTSKLVPHIEMVDRGITISALLCGYIFAGPYQPLILTNMEGSCKEGIETRLYDRRGALLSVQVYSTGTEPPLVSPGLLEHSPQ